MVDDARVSRSGTPSQVVVDGSSPAIGLLIVVIVNAFGCGDHDRASARASASVGATGNGGGGGGPSAQGSGGGLAPFGGSTGTAGSSGTAGAQSLAAAAAGIAGQVGGATNLGGGALGMSWGGDGGAGRGNSWGGGGGDSPDNGAGASCSSADAGQGAQDPACLGGTSSTVVGGAGGQSGEQPGQVGEGGSAGAGDGTCSAAANGDGTASISCIDGTTAVVSVGADGASCALVTSPDGTTSLSCADGSAIAVSSGDAEVACLVVDNEDGSATLSCTDGSTTIITPPRKAPGRRHVILIIGDGMQFEHEIATSRYLYGTDYAMSWRQFPYQGYCSTWDVDTYNGYAALAGAASFSTLVPLDPTLGYSPTLGGAAPYPVSSPAGAFDYFTQGGSWHATDSASSATAISTGQKTNSGNIAWRAGDPVDGALPTIAETLRAERGFAIGVVSSVPFSHATPAAFVAHNPSRGDTHGIADEIISSTKPEVVIGAGYAEPGMTSGYISSENVTALEEDPGVVFVDQEPGVDGGDALLAGAAAAVANGQRLFGLFGSAGADCEHRTVADAPGSPAIGESLPEYPKLADAALAALEVLATDDDGFFLLLEQGNIDWANHSNNYRGMLSCVADLDEAVSSVVEFVNREGDEVDWTNTLVLVTADHANSGMRLAPSVVLGPGDLPALSPSDCTGGCSFPDGEVSYATSGHTNELVTLSAMGMDDERDAIIGEWEGLEYPGTHIVDNTALYSIMRAAAGL